MKELTRRGLFAVAAAAVLTPVSKVQAAGRRAVVCYSRTGNTWALAEMIAEAAKADLFRIDVAEPYAVSYGAMTDGARAEVMRHAKRTLKTPIPDLSGYGTVFVGSPYWWGSLSTPMNTFLMDNPLTGKTVYPFITSGSSSPDGALERIRALVAGTVGDYFYVPGADAVSARRDIERWVKRLNLV